LHVDRSIDVHARLTDKINDEKKLLVGKEEEEEEEKRGKM
jgi:hypothetical protein